MQEKTFCAIYTRVSTDNQAEVEFNSCESQKEKIEHFIQSQEGFSVYKIYSDEGYSGKDMNRPALQSLLREIEVGRINCVITYKMDRLTRCPKDFYQMIEHFDKYKVNYISVTERFDISTPAGRLLRNIMLTFAQFEREISRERTMDKLLQRAQKGMWNGGIVPYGYKAIDKKLIIDEHEARVVRFIYDLYIKTGSLAIVYNTLKIKGYFYRNGKPFSKSAIFTMLRNVVYTGKNKYGSKIYQGIHQTIITQDIFDLAQTKHGTRPSNLRKYKEFLFAGLVRCAECGSIMTPSYVTKIRKGRHIRYYYYRCTCTYKRDWNSCSIKQVNANRFEEYIFDNLERINLDKTYIDNLIFRHTYQNAKSSNFEAEEFSPTLRSGYELEPPCLEELSNKFRRSLNFLIKAAEKIHGADRCHTIKQYVKDILFSKETIQINIYLPTNADNEEGSLKQASEKSDAHPQDDCAKFINGNRIGDVENGLKYRETADSADDDPRRSAEGRGAEGDLPSVASSRAHEVVRGAEAKRGFKELKSNGSELFQSGSCLDWLRTDNPKPIYAGSFNIDTYQGERGKYYIKMILEEIRNN